MITSVNGTIPTRLSSTSPDRCSSCGEGLLSASLPGSNRSPCELAAGLLGQACPVVLDVCPDEPTLPHSTDAHERHKLRPVGRSRATLSTGR